MLDKKMTMSDLSTVAPFNTQNIPTVAMLSTQNIGTLYIWFGVVEDLAFVHISCGAEALWDATVGTRNCIYHGLAYMLMIQKIKTNCLNNLGVMIESAQSARAALG